MFVRRLNKLVLAQKTEQQQRVGAKLPSPTSTSAPIDIVYSAECSNETKPTAPTADVPSFEERAVSMHKQIPTMTESKCESASPKSTRSMTISAPTNSKA